jgi:hypothetical protein
MYTNTFEIKMKGELNGEVYELEVATNQMNDKHVLAAKDIVRMCEERGYHDLSQAIRIRYGLAEINYYNPSESKFVQACDAIGLNGCVQGHVHTGDETAVRYPIISVNGDIRKFDELFDYIKNA